jgi:hypothetical protein
VSREHHLLLDPRQSTSPAACVGPKTEPGGLPRLELIARCGGPLAVAAAVEERNRKTKETVIDEARAIAHAAGAQTDRTALDDILDRWTRIGSAGSEHDASLRWQLTDACADFFGDCEAKRTDVRAYPDAEGCVAPGATP